MAYRYIVLDQTDGVAALTLNRPEVLNAMHRDVSAELVDALDRVRDDGTSRALLITGAGRAFCSGADLVGGSLQLGPDGDAGAGLEVTTNPLMERFRTLPVPVITAVNGPAVGVGCSLALAGDIVLAARSAYFLLAFVNIGLIPDGGVTWMLPRLIGRARAQAMMMLGERVGADQAEAWGMIYRAVDDADLMPTARQLAEKLAKGPTRSYALIRQGIRQALDASFSETLAMERIHQRIAGRTADCSEGVAAFKEKRRPNFQGR